MKLRPKKRTYVFIVALLLAGSLSSFRALHWVFISDFLTYRIMARDFSTHSIFGYLSSGIGSVRPTEPLFILIYYAFGPYAYIIVPIIALIFYLIAVSREARLTLPAVLGIFLLALVTPLEAFQLQRQFISIVFVVYALLSQNRARKYLIWLCAVLTHNSAIFFFPLFLKSALAIPMGVLISMYILGAHSVRVGGAYHLKIEYIFLLAVAVSVIYIRRSNLSLHLFRSSIIIFLLQFIFIFSSPYIGSRLFFSTFFALVIPLLLIPRQLGAKN